ncbi:MAG TPA: hypothetical protein PKA06_12680 [Gemmatales bacterium]|nr:hypothetical protein [Gemmatales bacterium]
MSKTRLLCCNALYAGLLLAVFAGPLAADDIFYFGPSEKYDASSRFSAVNIRPNHQSSQYLFVVSPKEINKATIEMRGLDGKVWARSPTMKLDAEEVRLIQFEKMPDKKQEEKKPETPSTEPGKTEASPPVPPGNLILPSRENGNDSLSFQFIMVLIEEREKDNKLERVEYPEAKVITILSPDKYSRRYRMANQPSLPSVFLHSLRSMWMLWVQAVIAGP